MPTIKQPIHYKYGAGFCGNCGDSAKTIVIADWYPTGIFIPHIEICKPCLTQMLEDFK